MFLRELIALILREYEILQGNVILSYVTTLHYATTT